ncbi:DUF4011 domain-containing anti-phage protein Hhe [Mangrovitalea sediminis]|uniref:DUF4011 domain-containing anti-phage protein Hhe n=1 Tax=Mangrovitalea sediminis TaxID=1982043 RepID=UPI000BE627B4|nr:DUF4011 domain-containing anti-phage protein Hhe [Mangrovitalea sediminis]
MTEQSQSITESLKSQNPFTLDALETMRKKLLDLTSRNRLLNFPITQKGSSLRIIDELPDQLFQELMDDKTLHFQPVPPPTREELIDEGYLTIDPKTGEDKSLKPAPDAKEWAKVLGLDTGFELPRADSSSGEEKHQDDAIQVLLYPPEMEARLRTIRNKAQTAIEETGASILYLSLGFLEWFESDESDKARLAPLFTLPVALTRGEIDSATGTYVYTLKYTGEDILSNLSLREKLALDFGLVLPDIETDELPEHYLDRVAELIHGTKPRWSVRRYGALCLLNFGKMLMYLDLDPERWPTDQRNLVHHPIINRFFTSEETERSAGGASVEHPIDELPDVHEQFPLIDDADSSQHSALIDAVKGENLVVEGPPGTGKSQTITNLIAAAMLRGKKVLFVAEKMAALEVVKNRLDKAGLGDFCLELHSHKSQKRKVLDDLQTRLHNQKHLRSTRAIDAEIARYEQLKEELNAYAKEINSTWKQTGKSIHEVFSAASRYRESVAVPAADLHIEDLDGENLNTVRRLQLRDQVREFQDIYSRMREQIGDEAPIEAHPWFGVERTDIPIFDADRIVNVVNDWQQSLIALAGEGQRVGAILGLAPGSLSTLSQIEALALDLADLPILSERALLLALSSLNPLTIEEVEQYLRDHRDLQARYKELAPFVNSECLKSLAKGEPLPAFADLMRLTGAARDLPLTEVVADAVRVEQIKSGLDEVYEVISQLKAALPSGLAGDIDDNYSGLRRALGLLVLVGKLDGRHLSMRTPLLDDDGVDALLADMSQRLEVLLPLHELIQGTYSTERLLSEAELDSVKAQLERPGMGKWFSGDWWRARKTLKGQASKPGIKLTALRERLEQAIEYASRLAEFQARPYEAGLGDQFRGLNTDVQSLTELRHWYKQVRNVYGVGFGPRVALGDELLSLSPALIKGMHQLRDSGVADKLRNLLGDLDQLSSSLPKLAETITHAQSLSGPNGSLAHAGDQLKLALEPIQSWFSDTELDLESLQRRIDELRELSSAQREWSDNALLDRVFEGAVSLSLGPSADNQETLEAIRDTLDFANYIHRRLRFDPLRDVILDIENHSDYLRVKQCGEILVPAWEAQEAALDVFRGATELNLNGWLKTSGDDLSAVLARNELAMTNPAWLNDWVNYVRIRNEMAKAGLERLWRQVSDGRLAIADVEAGLNLAIFDQLSREVVRERPHLARVSGKNQEAKQNTFREYDQKLKTLQRERIASEVAEHNAPEGVSGGRKSDYTELSLLRNELGKKSRHIPIRQLINRASRAIQELKPCFMMGPMSAAHYLKPGHIEFDLVVMDEASQVKPEDALGVIARGRQLVVVGDPKQLPPTSFFDRQDMTDGEDDAALAQTDSILDASLPLFRMRRLRWHYRSQHESLIAFSNRNFYDNDLVIFPSPNAQSEEFGIKFHHVRGGRFVNQYNVEEAGVVAKAAVKHALERPHESLGIVAMSAKQAEQIERALEEACKADPTLADVVEKLRTQEDGLFVKNLENVQGDERDVIFISFTYGPGEVGGRVYQRFGPINSDVGWRRLNVLFTRSKKRMHVFSSMRADDILTSENTKRGVIALRNFLHFAERGNMDGVASHTGKAPDSDFEVAVIDALYREGFECEAQVGVAGFYIDIAVRDPGNRGRYLMGIECDGATYHSAKTARDRDRLRQEVLERLGWRIRRIWSTDWFSNPKGELEPILRELHQLKTTSETARLEIQETSLSFDALLEESAEDLQQLSGFDAEMPLRERLQYLSDKVIARTFPDTPAENRLLRPGMIEALVEHQPVDRSEFVEFIPEYLREATSKDEARQYLDLVLDVVAGAELESEVEG